MERLTLSSVRSAIAEAIGCCADDDRVARQLNKAQRRLMAKNKWVGTTVRYRVCVSAGCLTWPRQIETIEAFAICDCPGRLRDQWFEFLGHGRMLVGERLQPQAHPVPSLAQATLVAQLIEVFHVVRQEQAEPGHVARESVGLELLDAIREFTDGHD